jgi:hypothetical protein
MGALTQIGDKLSKVTWLAREPARGFLESLAGITDVLVSGVHEGFFAAFGPSPPADAVPFIAKDRALVPGLIEPPSAFAVRAPTWIDVRRTAGNVRTCLQSIQNVWAPVYPRVRCVRNIGTSELGDTCTRWSTRETDGSFWEHIADPENFNWDNQRLPHRAFFIIYAPSSPLIYREGKCGDGSSYHGERRPRPFDGVYDKPTTGTTAFADYISRTREAIATTIPASLLVPWIIVAFDMDSFDPYAAPGTPGMPDGTWEHAARYDETLVRYVETRNKTARYWMGLR